MAETFHDYVSRIHADRETIQVAARYYIAERSDYLDPEEIEDEIRASMAVPERLPEVIAKVAQDPRTIELASTALLSAAWSDPIEQATIKRALDGAKSKLPVVEVGILALTAIYGMYLLATGGVKRERSTTETSTDGTTKTTTETEYFGVDSPLSALLKIFHPGS